MSHVFGSTSITSGPRLGDGDGDGEIDEDEDGGGTGCFFFRRVELRDEDAPKVPPRFRLGGIDENDV